MNTLGEGFGPHEQTVRGQRHTNRLCEGSDAHEQTVRGLRHKQKTEELCGTRTDSEESMAHAQTGEAVAHGQRSLEHKEDSVLSMGYKGRKYGGSKVHGQTNRGVWNTWTV